MSENEKQAARIKSRWWRVGQGWSRELDEADLVAEIAAAEERGQRAGIEEARKAIASEANGNRGGDYERRLRMLAELVASLDLAPRDSGKDLSAKVGRSDSGLPVVNFDRDVLHGKDRK